MQQPRTAATVWHTCTQLDPFPKRWQFDCKCQAPPSTHAGTGDGCWLRCAAARRMSRCFLRSFRASPTKAIGATGATSTMSVASVELAAPSTELARRPCSGSPAWCWTLETDTFGSSPAAKAEELRPPSELAPRPCCGLGCSSLATEPRGTISVLVPAAGDSLVFFGGGGRNFRWSSSTCMPGMRYVQQDAGTQTAAKLERLSQNGYGHY
jgi:hypothetical protein